MVEVRENASEEDLRFLEELDRRLHYVEKHHIHLTGEVEIDSYHRDKKMTKNETNRLLGLVRKSGDLVLYPINTNWGFSVGFAVTQTRTPFPCAEGFETRLVFIRDQLPKGYGWQNLEEVFNSRENVERIRAIGLGDKLEGFRDEGFKTEDHYEY